MAFQTKPTKAFNGMPKQYAVLGVSVSIWPVNYIWSFWFEPHRI